jgi:hypothetical protein
LLDFLEWLGLELDGLDSSFSLRLQQRLFPDTPPQSLCSYLRFREKKIVVAILGKNHVEKSYLRYHRRKSDEH